MPDPNERSRSRAGDPASGAALSLYACPVCGELPPGCRCLRPVVRDRIAESIHFRPEAHAASLPFLVREPELSLDPPDDPGDLAVA